MNKSCQVYQMELMDVHYGESKMTDSLRSHLDVCEECSRYWEGLGELPASMEFPELEDPFKNLILNKVMSESAAKANRNNSVREFAVFMLLATMFLGTCLYLAFSGHAIPLLKIYLSIFIIAPLSLPFLVKRQIAKEEHTNGRA